MAKTVTVRHTNTNREGYTTEIHKYEAQNIGNPTNDVNIIHF